MGAICSKAKRTFESYNVWFRHSGMEPVSSDIQHMDVRSYTAEEIQQEVGDNEITDLKLDGDLPSNIGELAPDVTNLCIIAVKDDSSLRYLSQLTNLSKLNIGDNRLTVVPKAIISLSSLTELNLQNCGISTLPERLESLAQLSTLDLSGNDFSGGLPGCISKLITLNELHLGSCKLSSLPEKLETLAQLSTLDLSGNDFSGGLPGCISKLISLNELHLGSCKLSSLPETLESLAQLSTLDLSGNDFSGGLPGCISKLISLNELLLGSCKLSSLPETLPPKLSKLGLSGNDFSGGLPGCVTELISLNKLYLGSCNLSSLPAGLPPKLSKLGLSGNDFSGGLPGCVTKLISLIELLLGSCKLSSLPERLGSLPHLSKLHLHSNDFSTGLPECVPEIRSLKELDLERCKLSSLPDKLGSLTELSTLDLSGNDFSGGLPECITELCSLQELYLVGCKLSSLPDKLDNLSMLVKIDISRNMFGSLPPVICKLSKLRELILGSDYGENETLKTLDFNLLNLHQLKVINCTGCKALISPPYAVCEQGLQSILGFYNDMQEGSDRQPIISTVAVIGELMSGKTSLIRSLMTGERELIDRNITSVVDNTTKVFEMQELALENYCLRIVDFGGHEVYHMAYQLTLKDNCIPLIVVNMEQYFRLSEIEELEAKEAAGRVCFNWMSHLYLSCPRLGRPFLILTHKDKFCTLEFDALQNKLVTSLESLRRDFLREKTRLELENDSTCMLHFDQTNTPLFNSENIFSFGNDADDSDNLDRLKQSLHCYIENSEIEIPLLWQHMSNYIESEADKPFLTLSQFQERYPEPAQLVVLRYLHNIGKVLWYEKEPSLDSYIFHQISEITNMIALLFHHNGFEEWNRRVENFQALGNMQSPMDQYLYRELVEEFKESGQLDKAILVDLFDNKSRIHYDTAMAILQTFNIVHGPTRRNLRTVFILPALSSENMSSDMAENGDLQLKAEIAFESLTLPKYVHHLLTVAVLNIHDASDSRCYKYAFANGAKIQRENITTHLLHDFDNRRLLVQVSTSLCEIAASWKLLADICKTIVSRSKEKCEATRPVIRLFCSHCLFVRDPDPGTKSKTNDWVYPDAHQIPGYDEAEHFSLLKCFKHSSGDILPSIPSPLLGPCTTLNEEETEKLQTFLNGLTRFPPPRDIGPSPVTSGDSTPPSTPASASSSSNTLSSHQTPDRSDDEESDFSEKSDFSDDMTYMEEKNKDQARISYRLKPCILRNIRRLFNSDSVYRMSQPIRGRCLIINNEKFHGSPAGEPIRETREGSEADVINITNVFEALFFECELLRNLKGQTMLDEITEETRRQEHAMYGMFILVIMSHGGEQVVYGTDGEAVGLSEIYERMYTYEFRLMAGRPRVIIIQACAGRRVDSMGQLSYDSPAHAEPNEVMRGLAPVDPVNPNQPLPGEHQDVDDIYVMKSSVPGFIAHRHRTHGTWFIRALVEVLYKHSSHRDLVSLFEQVRNKVRKKALQEHARNTNVGGQMPTTDMNCLRPGKKLYLFPGYNPGI